jgi:uncharacterized protein YjbJ (UPF0337 family)
MDENRISGTARNLGGKAEESFGRATGDTKTQAEGVANQIKGAAQTSTAGRGTMPPTWPEPPATQKRLSNACCATPLKSSPIPPSRLRLASAGCSDGCIGRFETGTGAAWTCARWNEFSCARSVGF